MRLSEWLRYFAVGALGGYLIAALLCLDNRLSLAGDAFFRLGCWLALLYGLGGVVAGGMAGLSWRILRRVRDWPVADRQGREMVFVGLLVFALLFFWNFDSFYHYSTFEFWLLVRRLLTESFVPLSAEGATNLVHLLLLVAVSAAAGLSLSPLRRLAEAVGRGRLGRGAVVCLVLLPWLAEAGLRLTADEETAALLARPGRKVLIIGVDALDWKIGNELMAAGELPNLKALAERGVAAPLHTFVPAYSPMVWTTIATGRSPEVHNIRHFNAYGLGGAVAVQPLVEPSLLMGNPYVLRLLGQAGLIQPFSVTSNTRKFPAFWDLASRAGLGTTVLGWWVTSPVEAINGIMVSDYATHTDLSPGELEGQVYPGTAKGMVAAQLQAARRPPREILERLFTLTPEEWARWQETDPDAQPAAMREVIRSLEHDYGLFSVAEKCLEAGQPEVLAVFFEGIDTAGHLVLHYWLSEDPGSLDQADRRRYRDTARAYHRLVDQWVGELCRKVDPDSYVLLVSDHGFALEEPPHYFHHKTGPAGVILLSGPAIAAVGLDRAHVLDVAPTLYFLLGLPVAGDLEGRVLEEAFLPAFREKYPPNPLPSYAAYRSPIYQGDEEVGKTTPASEAVVNRLKTLGYIE